MISAALTHFLNQLPEATPSIVVGYSGGVDSHLLLVELAQLKQQGRCTLSAIHIHHGLSHNADAWQSHCENICEKLSVPLIVHRVVVENQGKGLEAAAREARYQAFKENIPDKAYLCLAHHQDDQLETLLLRLLRGTGVLGLQGMLPLTQLHHFTLVRPLLEIPRAEILARAQALNLQWIEDESNNNLHFRRNYLRHKVIPLLREQWPSLGDNFFNLSHWSLEAQQVCEDQAEQDYQQMVLRGINQGVAEGAALNRLLVMNLSLARQKNLLRYWLRLCGVPMPSAEQLAEIQQQCLVQTETEDRHPKIVLGDFCVTAFQEGLYLLKDPTLALPLPGEGIKFTEVIGEGLKKSLWNDPSLQVRNRIGGERFHLAGKPHHTTLKKLLQENKVAPWLRDSMSLVFLDEQLIAIPLLGFIAEGCVASGDEEGVEFQNL